MSTASNTCPKSLGRPLVWLGITVSLAGIVAYMVVIMAFHTLHTPWYAPALATAGAILILAALFRRRTVTRVVALLFFAALAGLEWWFLLVMSTLPAYTGPVAVGKPFPEFTAARADGATFTRADLVGGKDTIIVFFRGRW